jgi:hypothetical protein
VSDTRELNPAEPSAEADTPATTDVQAPTLNVEPSSAVPPRDKRRKKNGRLTRRERRRINKINGSKAVGKKSPLGRRRSSMNACTHSLCIKDIAILSERVGDLQAHYQKWIDFYKPASPGELELCETAFVGSLQKKRILKTQASRINSKIDKARLMYDRAQEDALEKARELFATNPGLAMVHIKRLAIGCRWLLGRFQRLAAVVQRDGYLAGSDRDELISYMGGEPYIDRLVYGDGAWMTWLSCEVCRPEPDIEEMKTLCRPECQPETIRGRDQHTWLGPRPFHRYAIEQMIEEQIAELTRREHDLRVNHEDVERERAEKNAAALTDADGPVLQRYYHMHNMDFTRAYDRLVKGKELTARTGRIPGEPTETVGAATETVAAQNEANGASQDDVTPDQQQGSSAGEDSNSTPESSPEESAARRREAAEALAPSEANGIGAPIFNGDRFITVLTDSQWWTEDDTTLPEGGIRVDEYLARAREHKQRE